MLDALGFDAVFVDGLAAALEDVFAFFGCFLVVVEEGGILQFFGAGRVDFATAAADLTQATRTD